MKGVDEMINESVSDGSAILEEWRLIVLLKAYM